MGQKPARSTKRRPSRKNLETALAAQGIVVTHPGAVRDYVASHRKLARILPSVCERARREFGHQAELMLKVYQDPETSDRHLTLYVRLPAYDDMTIARIDRVTQDFDEALCRASGYLLLTTDFRPPRTTNAI
jgi:hypothetical protein